VWNRTVQLQNELRSVVHTELRNSNPKIIGGVLMTVTVRVLRIFIFYE
jgi:hypothetical protein